MNKTEHLISLIVDRVDYREFVEKNRDDIDFETIVREGVFHYKNIYSREFDKFYRTFQIETKPYRDRYH